MYDVIRFLPPSVRCQACGDYIDEHNNCACPAGSWDEPEPEKDPEMKFTFTIEVGINHFSHHFNGLGVVAGRLSSGEGYCVPGDFLAIPLS